MNAQKLNVIQLINGITILVDDNQFKKVKQKFKSVFCKFLTVTDSRKCVATIRKKDILLLEERPK